MNILEKIRKNREYFKEQKGGDWVMVEDVETGDIIYMPASCVYNCVVLALKETGYRGHIRIIHDTDYLIRADGYPEEYYAEYALGPDRYVHMVDRHGCVCCYGERDKA